MAGTSVDRERMGDQAADPMYAKTEMSFFDPPPIQNSIRAGDWSKYNPIGGLNTTPYEFKIPAKGKQYIDIEHMYLYVKGRITTRAGGNLHLGAAGNGGVPAQNNCCMVNDMLNVLWDEIDVTINGRVVSDQSRMYSYRAFMEKALNLSSDATKRFSAGGYFPDSLGTGGQGQNPTANAAREDHVAACNTGLKQSYQLSGTGHSFQLMGPIHGDIFNSNRVIPNGVDLELRLTPSTNEFRIISNTAVAAGGRDEIVTIEDIYIKVRYIDPTPEQFLHHQSLYDGGVVAKFPINRLSMRARAIPEGSTQLQFPHIWQGQLPTRLFFMIVPTEAFAGSYTHNPFHAPARRGAQHDQDDWLTNVRVRRNGDIFPREAYDMVAANDAQAGAASAGSVKAYHELMLSLGCGNKNTGPALLTREYWYKNLQVFGLDFSPDFSEGDHFNITETGDIDIELVFNEATEGNNTVIIMGEFQNTITINRDRLVMLDYA